MKRHFQCGDDPRPIRPWSDHENANRNPPRKWDCFSRSPEAFSIVKYNVSRPILHSNLHQILRLPQKDTLDLHQVLHLPRKISPMLDPRYIWNLISNARSNRSHDPTSPNTSPATKNDTGRFERKSPKTGETSFPMRGRSDHAPTMIRPWSDHENANRNPPRKWACFSRSPEAFFSCKIQRFAPNLTFKPSPNTAPTTKRYTWPSPSAAPATKSDITNFSKYCTCHEKWHLNFSKYCTCHEKWHLNFTKYCACHCTVTELYCTLLDLTLLYLTLLYVTLLYLTLLDLLHLT